MKRTHLAAYVGVVAVAALGLWRVETTANRADTTANAVEHEAELRAAQQCVAGHERVDQLKALGEEAVRSGARVGAEAASSALVQIGIEQGQPPPPGVEERFKEILNDYVRTQSDAEVARVQDTVEVVTPCDLDAARRTLEEG